MEDKSGCTTYGAVFIGDQQPVNKIVSFDPETGKVYDSKKNYIGQGEIKNGILQITPANT